MSDEAEASETERSRWWPLSRRGKIVVGIVAFLVVVRIALPPIARVVIESQGSKYLKGQLTVENVDLWLLSGAVALEGVSLWPDGEAPTEEQPATEPALVAWKRIYVEIGWTPLFDRIANVQNFELDGLAVNVARLHDGTIVIPDLRELPAEDDEPEDDTPSEPLGVLIDRAALLNAKVRVRDDVPGRPTYRELTLPSLEVRELAIGDEEATAPGQITLQAGLRDGSIRVDAQVSEQDGGFATDTRIDISHLPLDQLHVHEPTLGWTKSSGRLDASLHIEVDAAARIRVSGTTSVSDLRIEVPDEEKPGLAWRRFEIEINEVDVAQQRVDLARIALDGGSVLLRPLEQPPAPILPAGLTAEATPPESATVEQNPVASEPLGAPDEAPVEQPVAEPVPAPDAEPVAAAVAAPEAEPVATAVAAPDAEPAVAPDAAPSDTAPADTDAMDWTVKLGVLEVTDTGAGILLEQGPARGHIGKLSVTDVDATTTTWSVGAVNVSDTTGGIELATGSAKVEIVQLTVKGATSDPSKPVHVVAKIKEDTAVIDVDAQVTQQPQKVEGKLDLENVVLGRYADLSGASPVHLPSGTLQAALALSVNEQDVEVSGQIALDELQVLTQDGKEDFSVAWDALALDIRSFEAIVGDAEAPMNLELADLQVTNPNIRVTLTKEGIVLPTVREAAPEGPAGEPKESPTAEAGAAEPAPGDTAEAGADEAAPSHEPVLQDGLVVQTESVGVEEIAEFAEPAANLPLGLAIDRLRVDNGTFRVVDRAVRPTYRGKITEFDFDITGVDLPYDAAPTDAVFEKMSLDLIAPGDAPIKIRAGTEAKGVRVDANIEKLPLSQFNPYVRQASGYTVLEGAATIESSVLWAKERYESDTDITLRTLDVGSESGGTLFRDTFGISISAALALMRDVTGKIGLAIPVNGSVTQGTEIGLGSVVGQAITKAIFNAITSPLKMLSVVTMLGDKVGDITPMPVEFEPGKAEITKSASEKADKIGDVLASTPLIKIELVGRANAADVRGLKELAVLADMEGESGFFGGLRNLASGGTRNAIRTALEDGDVASLSESERESLDDLLYEKTVEDADLTKLANARAKKLYDILIEDDGVPEEQVTIGAPEVSRDDDGGSDVRVNLVSRG